ncbi:uncharacterized protein LOC143430651 [Xylocopa sonorina]|uniref:uncharacterized protein LOC143430651 n=1 Tax=Xylocopa sonorina TaxID=1818115 RepID=UPI00403AE593
MLVLCVALLLSALNAAAGEERRFLASNHARPKREAMETGQSAAENFRFHQFQPIVPSVQNIQPDSLKSATVQASPLITIDSSSPYSDIFKQSSVYSGLPISLDASGTQSNEQLVPYADNLFTMSAGYKIGGVKSQKPTGTSTLQVPVYKTSQPLTAVSPQQQIHAHSNQNKKASLPQVRLQNGQELPSYLASFQNQPLVTNAADHQLYLGGRTPKVNNLQLSAPFLSPLSSFQGQVVPISTVTNNQQFPRYKGAAIEVYPTVGGFSPMAAYQPLQSQPQLQFKYGSVPQLVDGSPRQSTPAQGILYDVELIDKKNPQPPSKKDGEHEDDDGEDKEGKDDGQTPHENDDDELKPRRYFKAPQTESNFKPSTSFPFNRYDEKFAKHSSQNRDEEADNDSEDERAPSSKYHSGESSSRSNYDRQESDDDEDDDRQGYERQRNEEAAEDTRKVKYLDKDFDEEFEASYRRKSPKQKHVHAKEVPELKYGSPSSKKEKGNHKSKDSSGEGSHGNFKHHKFSQDLRDSVGHSSDIVTEGTPGTIHEENFGYKIPRRNKAF